MTTLTICIPSFKRNLQLKALLVALQEQEHPSSEVDVEILVVDNNPDGRARQVTDTAPAPRYTVGYHHETRPGVAYVRNSALEKCADRDFLVFIDDDEIPAQGWLKALWARRSESGADAVFGSVEARYAEGVPGWVLRGDFHSKLQLVDGPRDKPGATDNCLIDLNTVRRLGLSFDPGLSMVGGEDTLFFDAMLNRGAVFADAAGAVAYECVPTERATLGWLTTRWRRTGYTDALMISKRRPNWARRPVALAEGLVRLGVGGLLSAAAFAVSGFRMHERVGRFLYTFQRGRGMMAFSLDKPIEEYARTAPAAGS